MVNLLFSHFLFLKVYITTYEFMCAALMSTDYCAKVKIHLHSVINTGSFVACMFVGKITRLLFNMSIKI